MHCVCYTSYHSEEWQRSIEPSDTGLISKIYQYYFLLTHHLAVLSVFHTHNTTGSTSTTSFQSPSTQAKEEVPLRNCPPTVSSKVSLTCPTPLQTTTNLSNITAHATDVGSPAGSRTDTFITEFMLLGWCIIFKVVWNINTAWCSLPYLIWWRMWNIYNCPRLRSHLKVKTNKQYIFPNA